eukprot:scaffold59514_cov37-Cyclotella_meneghiniana.AAC.1
MTFFKFSCNRSNRSSSHQIQQPWQHISSAIYAVQSVSSTLEHGCAFASNVISSITHHHHIIIIISSSTVEQTGSLIIIIHKKMKLLATPPARYGHAFASIATVVSLAIIVILAVLSRYTLSSSASTLNDASPNSHHHSSSSSRWLYVEDTSPFTSHPCEDIFDSVPTDVGREHYLCHYAKHCHGGWPSTLLLPFILCRDIHDDDDGDVNNKLPSTSLQPSSIFVHVILPPITLSYLYLLFRLLATTADSYFSPALETFSFELGLPPRFAGATLLALGNGSPDLGSTINSILLWNEQQQQSTITNNNINSNSSTKKHNKPPGWTLCLGSLTGGGMFVGTIVTGLIIQSCNGIPCRGALVRDVSMYALSIILVWIVTESNVVTRNNVYILLGLWVFYVVTVLAADLYHRKVTLVRLHAEGKERKNRNSLLMTMTEMQVEAANQAVMDTIQHNNDVENEISNEQTPLVNTSLHHDNYTTNNEIFNGDDNEELTKQRPSLSTTDRFAMLMSNYDPASVKFSYNSSPRSNSGLSNDDASETTLIHDIIHELHEGNSHHPHHHPLSNNNVPIISNNGVDEKNTEIIKRGETTTMTTLHSFPEGTEDEESIIDDEGIHRSCCSFNLLSEAYQEIVYEAGCYWQNRYKDESSRLEKFGFLLELPFTVIRTLTIPVPCEDHYNRVTDFSLKSMVFCVTTSSVAFGVLRYGSDDKLPLVVAAPLSLYGFLIAATWIDVIGDNLVGLLEFLGTICRIPAPILGVTVLAWGNSLGDLSANVAMARKGMPDMATTANFAGPSFNMLLGVGFGFLALQNKLETSTISPRLLRNHNLPMRAVPRTKQGPRTQ